MPSILIIEDDDEIRQVMKQILESVGYDVHEASDGKAGTSLFRENQADLVITDIIMPVQEGIETIRQLRKIKPELKIIAISGGGRIDADDYLFLAKRLGADATLSKPFEMKTLISTVRNLLR